MFATSNSKSTDKLTIICENLNNKILNDEQLKARVKSIKISWVTLKGELADDILFAPELDVQFKD